MVCIWKTGISHYIGRAIWKGTTDKKKKNAKQYCQREKRSNKHLFSNLIKCNSCGFSYRRYQKQYSPNRPPKVWWTCSKRSSYGSGRCDSEYIRIDEDWLKSALNTLFKSLLDDRESFFTLVETRCNSIIKEYIRNTSGIVLEEVENRLDELKQERERLKNTCRKSTYNNGRGGTWYDSYKRGNRKLKLSS